jgi:hypothetical protein
MPGDAVAKEPNAAELHTIAVVGDPEVRAALLDATCQRAALDEVLRVTARRLERSLADVACVARIGGDDAGGPRRVRLVAGKAGRGDLDPVYDIFSRSRTGGVPSFRGKAAFPVNIAGPGGSGFLLRKPMPTCGQTS